jgi:hypothetical protein
MSSKVEGLNSGKVKEYGKMPLCWDGVHADHIRETFKQKKNHIYTCQQIQQAAQRVREVNIVQAKNKNKRILYSTFENETICIVVLICCNSEGWNFLSIQSGYRVDNNIIINLDNDNMDDKKSRIGKVGSKKNGKTKVTFTLDKDTLVSEAKFNDFDYDEFLELHEKLIRQSNPEWDITFKVI